MESMHLPSRFVFLFLFLFLASFFWVILDKAMAEGVKTVIVISPAAPPPPGGATTVTARALTGTMYVNASTAPYSPEANTTLPAGGTTDPLEVQALNRVFQQWNLTAPPNMWNISGEPCSGAALSETRIDDMGYWRASNASVITTTVPVV
ncbi:hypothetical protein NL676_030204 [Syzygium grande]|nr:hypothetical protein NL676_030204 [Syzygium grande]